MSQPDLQTPLVRTVDLTKSFGNTRANRAVSLTLHPGRVHALLGENGAGKSTLISMLAGFVQPDAGSILLNDDQAVFASPAAALDAGIATVFQRSHLVAELSIRDNVRLQRRVLVSEHTGSEISFAEQLAATEQFIAQLNAVPIALDTVVGTLDLGSRQIVEIARALARQPKLLILDEPTSLISTESAQRLLALLRSLTEKGMSVLFVTHRLAEVIALADEVTVLRHGEVRATFDTAQPKEEDALLGAMFGEAEQPDQTGQLTRTTRPRHAAEVVPILELREVSTEQSVSQRNLENVSFSVSAGEILGIAGISGNGQQHLAEVIEGTLTPAQGSLWLDGHELTRTSVRDRIALGIRSVTDDRFGEGLVPTMSLGLNLLLKRIGSAPFWRFGVTDDRAINEHAAERVASANIVAPAVTAPTGTLSGGNAQKLLLARENDSAARVTVYRQPTHGLDAKTVAEVYAAIRAAAARGEGVIVISADLDEIIALSDRVLVLDQGALVASVVGHRADTRDEVARAMSGVRR